MDKEVQTIAIFFSKDRALQLDACLRSFFTQCQDVKKSCQRVIYTCSSERYEKQYKILAKDYKQVDFIRERSFRQDLIQALESFYFVLFVVDDNIFLRPWLIGEVLEALQDYTQSIGFSLRLGKNTTYCYSNNAKQTLPEFERLDPHILKFNWTKDCEYDFNYPLEVSSSIYRTDDVLSIINQSLEIKNPNELEIVLDNSKSEFVQRHPELFCFETSVAFCNPANITQHNYLNRFKTEPSTSIYSLSKEFDLGYRIDLNPFIDFIPQACHQEVEFDFIRPESATGTLTFALDLQSGCLLNVDKNEQAGEFSDHGRAGSSTCKLDMRKLDRLELRLVLEFIDHFRESISSSQQIPWLIQVLKRIDNERHVEVKEVYKIIKAFHDQLKTSHDQLKEQEKAKLWLEDERQKWESRALRGEQILDIQQQVLNSRAYKLVSILVDARHSVRSCLLLPLRLVSFFLPVRLRDKILQNFYRVQQRIYQLRYKIRNAKWPEKNPLVSVVIPCYNYGKYIEEAIDSVLAQTWHDFEIIVVDDGSNEPETLQVLDSLQKPKTRVLRQENLKLPAARNRGIGAAKGKYICCLDADDTIAPTYLEKCVYRLETDDLDICGSWQQNFENETETLVPGNFSLEALLESNRMINAAVFRRSLWRKTGGYDEKMTDGYEDWEFWIRMAAAGAKATVIAEPLFFYRKHGPSMIEDTLKKHESIVQSIRSKHAKLLVKPKTHAASNNVYAGPVQHSLRNLNRFQGETSDRLNILIALPYMTLGGGERIISRICSRLSQKKIGFIIINTVSPAAELGDTTSWFRAAATEIYNLPRFLPPNQWREFIFYLLATRNIQILWQIGSSFIYDLLPEIKSFFPSLKVVDLLFNEVGHGMNNRKFSYCIDLTVVENRRVESWLLTQGETSDRIRLIENGVDINKFTPNLKTEVLKKRSSESGKFIVGFFGRFSEEKGPDIFVEIASRLKSRTDIHFIMAGDGPLRDVVNRAVEKHQLQENVELPGIVNVLEELPMCDIVVVPSRMDGRPNIVLESLSMGIPVIASRVGGLEEIIDEGRTGFLCHPDEIETFVQRIISICDETKLREKMKVAARTAAENRFGDHLMFDSYAAMFRTIVNRRSKLESCDRLIS